MSIVTGNKITALMVSAANGDTYGDAERHLFRGIQTLVMPNVKNMTTSTPPGSPAFGDTYVVASAPTGAWTGNTNNIATWSIDAQDGVVTTGAWEFYAPQQGWEIYNQADGFIYAYNGTSWSRATAQPKTINASASGALTINAALGNAFAFTLTGNVTSMTISNPVDGQEITLIWKQDATGGRTVVYAGNVVGGAVINDAASAVTTQKLAYDSASGNWYPVSRAAASASAKVLLTQTASSLAIDAYQGNSFRIALSHAFTPLSLSINNPTEGQEISILFVQDSTGGTTITFPANIHGAAAITTTANAVSVLKLHYDSTNAVWYTISQTNGQ